MTVFNTSILTSFVTAGILCFLPTNSWHPVVNSLDCEHFSLIFMHVSEGERTVICEEAAESQEGFYELFSATSVSLICSSLPKRSAASSPGLHKDGIWGAASSIWSPLFSMLLEQCDEFPDDWQKISKWNNAQACSVSDIQHTSSHWHLRCSVKFRGPYCTLFAEGFWKVPDKDLPWCIEIQQSFKDQGQLSCDKPPEKIFWVVEFKGKKL